MGALKGHGTEPSCASPIVLQNRKDEELLKRRNIEPLLEDDDQMVGGTVEAVSLKVIVEVRLGGCGQAEGIITWGGCGEAGGELEGKTLGECGQMMGGKTGWVWSNCGFSCFPEGGQ